MNIVIIVAAGSSKRFAEIAQVGSVTAKTARDFKKNGVEFKDKLLAPILGKPLIYYTIQALHDHPQTHQIYIVANRNNKKALEQIVKKYHFPKVTKIVLGGKSRQQSVENGLSAAENRLSVEDIILVHNGANPFVTEEEISAVIAATKKFGAAAVGGKVVDTIKEIKNSHYLKTHDRDKLIAMQTPQAAQQGLLKKALIKAKKTGKIFTDETGLIENLGQKVKHIPASINNFKITTFHDYERAKIILGDTPQDFLVGIGQDSHAFAHWADENAPTARPNLHADTVASTPVGTRTLTDKRVCIAAPVRCGQYFGGLYLKDCPRLLADSDGDVILHAIYNALSQAIGEGSLGRIATPMFKEKNITNSRKYLEPLLKKIQKQGYHLNNLGLMIEAKIPKIDPIVSQLKKTLQQITGLRPNKIGITATSGENLTAFGRGEGVQVFAIVSLKK